MLDEIGRRSDVHLRSVQPYERSGFNSDIYTADSDKGQVTLHVIDPFEEQRRQKVHIKTRYLLDLLEETDIPTAEMYEVGEIQGTYYMIQEYLDGTPLGKRKLEDGRIVDEYAYDGYEDTIQDLIFKFNEIHIGGYGWLFGDETRYDTWREFLEKEAELWIETLRDHDHEFPTMSYIQEVLDAHSHLLSCEPHLVHGDLLNPSNILVKDGDVTGVVDYEWALAGDPAWDYAFTHDTVIDERFSEQVRLYKIFWNLWGAGMHVDDELFDPLYRRFRRALENF